jgi:hypothetical protein
VSADPGSAPSLYTLNLGYWNFQRAKLVVEAELEFREPTSEDVASALLPLEQRLWGVHFERMVHEGRSDEAKPLKRVSDVDLLFINNLRKLHGIDFVPTRKDDAESQVNELRLWCKHAKIAIHPRCRRTIAHLRAGIKTKNGKDWEIIEGFGHFDFIADLVYMVRNVDRARNPWPDVPFGITPRTHWFSPKTATPTVPREYAELASAWPQFTPGSR